jgi:uncharacterized membrane protein YeiH
MIEVEHFIYAVDIVGTLVFAISGVLTAVDKKFDFVGAIVIGTVTAIGGGTIRDLLIGSTPVGWLQDTNYLLTILTAILICYFFHNPVRKWRRGMFVFDTIGIGLFTILGVQKTLAIGLAPAIAITMGVVSAVFGGIIRDILTNREPLIFRKEIYATACLVGATIYVICLDLIPNQNICMTLGVGSVIIIRALAVYFHWSLPYSPRNWV